VRRKHIYVEYLKRYNQYSHLITTSELGKGENPKLNIASLRKARNKINQPTFLILQVVFSKVKVGLLKVNFPLVSNVGHNLGCKQIITYLMDLILRSIKGIYSTDCIRNTSKGKSLLPKENKRTYNMNTGKPVSGN
jgi:hypothetical protein